MGGNSSKFDSNQKNEKQISKNQIKKHRSTEIAIIGQSFIKAMSNGNSDAIIDIIENEKKDSIATAWQQFNLFYWWVLTAGRFSSANFSKVCKTLIHNAQLLKSAIKPWKDSQYQYL